MRYAITTITLLLLCITSQSNAQLGIKASIVTGSPNYLPGYVTHIGFNTGLNYKLNDRWRADLSLEMLFRKEKITYLSSSQGSQAPIKLYMNNSLTFISPVTMGVDYRFLKDKIRPFIGLNTGVLSTGIKINGEWYNSYYFAIQPKIGVDIALKENILLDFTMKQTFATKRNLTKHFSYQTIAMQLGLQYYF